MSIFLENRLLSTPILNFPQLIEDPHEQFNSEYYQQLRGYFFEDLLLYDHIAIPTYDFSIIGLMIKWLGIEIFQNLLDEQVLSFIRLTPWIGYGGNIGLSGFTIGPIGPSNPHTVIGFGTTNEALDAYCGKYISHNNYRKLFPLLQQSTDHLNLGTTFDSVIKPMSESVFSTSFPELSGNYGVLTLPGASSSELKIYSHAKPANTPADILLAIAQISIELVTLEEVHATHSATDQRVRSYLDTQGLNGLPNTRATQGHFEYLLHHVAIPQIPAVVNNGGLTIDGILKLRSKPSLVTFRQWLLELDPLNQASAVQEYIRILEEESIPTGKLFHILEFLLPTICNAFTPGSGMAIEICNLLSNLFGNSHTAPRLALNDLRATILPS